MIENGNYKGHYQDNDLYLKQFLTLLLFFILSLKNIILLFEYTRERARYLIGFGAHIFLFALYLLRLMATTIYIG